MLQGKMIFNAGLATLLLFHLAVLPTQAQALQAGERGMRHHKLDLKKLGKKRDYFVYLPGSRRDLNALPVIIVLHGAFSTARGIMKVTGFNRVAEREKLIVVYPNGAYGLFGLFQHWNAGHCCGRAAKDGNDDVGFILKVIEDVQARYRIDGRQVFLAGFSNGGMMAYRFCAEHPERVAAAAVLAGSSGGRASSAAPYWRIPEPRQPVPMILFHGRQDDSVPYEGGRDRRHRGEREYDAVKDAADFWARSNRCKPEPRTDYLLERRIERKTWSDKNNLPMVVLYSIDDWGHYWPGADYGRKHALPGFNATELIWEYFRQVSKTK